MQRAGLIRMRVSAGLFAFLIAAVLAAGAGAQTVDPASPPAQVRELLKLLGEPAVRDWLDENRGSCRRHKVSPARLSGPRNSQPSGWRLHVPGSTGSARWFPACQKRLGVGRPCSEGNCKIITPSASLSSFSGSRSWGLARSGLFDAGSPRTGTGRARALRFGRAPSAGDRGPFRVWSDLGRCIRARLNRRFPRVRMAATFEADCACLSRGRGSLARGNPLGPAAARTAPPRR